MSKFKVTPLQQGRHFAIHGPNLDATLTRIETHELKELLGRALEGPAHNRGKCDVCGQHHEMDEFL